LGGILKTATILLSRQPLRPCGTALWVQQTQKAVQWIKNQNLTLVSSTGMQTWDMITSLGSIENLSIQVFDISPISGIIDNHKHLYSQFNLDPSLVEIIPVSNSLSIHSEKEIQRLRDHAIVEHSDILIPVSIRPDGKMKELINEAWIFGKTIIDTFQCLYEAQDKSFKYSISPDEISSEAINLDDRYLIHWTRACNDPWPDELSIDYYRSIIDSTQYPRSAFDTLMRIITSKHLIASSRHMPGNIPTVSFSGLSPSEIRPLMRWRARYTQMSFEPYGIGIDKHAAFEAGIRPVNYFEGKGVISDDNSRIWLTQSRGVKTDWRNENEYRYQGNLSLTQFSDHDVIVICRTKDEANRIHSDTKLKTVPFCRS
jgi:hypothetical protein